MNNSVTTAIRRTAVLSVLLVSSGAADPNAALEKEAQQLAHTLMLIDTHMDTPYQLQKKMQDISGRIDGGHFDWVRARQGGLDAVFMAAYVPPEYEEQGGAAAFADRTIDLVEDLVKKWPDKFVQADSVEAVRQQFGDERVSILLGIENGSAIESDLARLQHFYDRGVRYITLVHSKNNHICDSSFDRTTKWKGLSPLGKKVVAEMNRLGMIIDVSHVSDDTFHQIIELSKAPVVATHSACRHFTPGWQRNMSDEMIRLLAAKGGVIQINFGAGFVNENVNRQFNELREEVLEYVEANNLQGEQRDKYVSERWDNAVFGKAHVSDVAANVDHVAKLVGVDHVGFGSDFDGVSNVPEGLEDVSCYPNLIGHLRRMGYAEDDLRKICAENFLRVWSQIERAASDP